MIPAEKPRPVSILLISHSYPPVLGGSEMEAQRVCSGLLRRGYGVTVVCCGGSPMPDTARWVDPYGVPVLTFGRSPNSRWRDLSFAAGVVWTLLRERRKYQVVYFLMQGLHLAAGLPVARLLGKPIVMKVSGSNIITQMRKSWMGRLELSWLRKWAHSVMILNSGMAGEAKAAGIERNLLWMPNPVDTAEFSPLAGRERTKVREALGLAENELVVEFVGRLAPEKELDTLIAAFAIVAQSVPQARLVIVGDGPCRTRLERNAAAAGLNSRIRFTGRQSPPQVRSWLQAGDVFALVSSLEGFPCSLLEAMSAGLPSVVSRIPANTQLIDSGVHGLYAEPRDARGLADALIRLLTDAKLRLGMGATARTRVIQHYSNEKVLDRYESLFFSALETVPPDAKAALVDTSETEPRA